jgi:mono/diheme cytochrome c family protein
VDRPAYLRSWRIAILLPVARGLVPRRAVGGTSSPLPRWERARERVKRIGHPTGWNMAILPLAVVLTAVACQAGAYPLDYFSEMHYQASIRAQEGPRKLPPDGSITYDSSGHPEAVQSSRNPRGTQVNYDFAQAANLRNPIPATPDNLNQAKLLFQTNCAVCHGAQGKGDGIVAGYFKAYNTGSLPVDFSQQRTKDRTEGQIWWIITNGLANMPSWKALLTEDERWLLTQFVRSVQ